MQLAKAGEQRSDRAGHWPAAVAKFDEGEARGGRADVAVRASVRMGRIVGFVASESTERREHRLLGHLAKQAERAARAGRVMGVWQGGKWACGVRRSNVQRRR